MSSGRGESDGGEADVKRVVEAIAVAASVVDLQGRFRWLNRGAVELFGDVLGRPFTRVVAPDHVNLARKQFALKLIGEVLATDYPLAVIDASGRRVHVQVCSAVLFEEGRITGVFALASPRTRDGGADDHGCTERSSAPKIALTARQYEVLTLLAEGLGTLEIAERLGVAAETTRNHIRALLRQLRVHTRLEAVVSAYRLGLLQLETPEDN